jgi:hypothetical protein
VQHSLSAPGLKKPPADLQRLDREIRSVQAQEVLGSELMHTLCTFGIFGIVRINCSRVGESTTSANATIIAAIATGLSGAVD